MTGMVEMAEMAEVAAQRWLRQPPQTTLPARPSETWPRRRRRPCAGHRGEQNPTNISTNTTTNRSNHTSAMWHAQCHCNAQSPWNAIGTPRRATQCGAAHAFVRGTTRRRPTCEPLRGTTTQPVAVSRSRESVTSCVVIVTYCHRHHHQPLPANRLHEAGHGDPDPDPPPANGSAAALEVALAPLGVALAPLESSASAPGSTEAQAAQAWPDFAAAVTALPVVLPPFLPPLALGMGWADS